MKVATGIGKKSWATPSVDELGVDETLGGQIPATYENVWNVQHSAHVGPVGTVPGFQP
jgi:hypothetical protein